MSFFFTYTAMVMTLILITMAVFLFIKGRKDSLTTIFIGSILASATWIGGNVLADLSHTPSTLICASAFAFVGGTFVITFFLLFVDTYVDGKLPSGTWIILYLLPTVLGSIFSFSEYAVLETIFPLEEPAQIVPGIHYYFSLLFALFGLLYGLRRLFITFKDEEGHRRLQTLYITIGFISLFIGGMVFSVLLPVLGELRFFNIAPQFSLIFVLSCGYAIYKHQLFDIRATVQRGLIYTILLVGIVGAYLLILTIVGMVLQQIPQVTAIISAGITSVIGIFTVPYIERYIRRKTDIFFFKERYDYASALYALSEHVSKKLMLAEIITQTQTELQTLFKTKVVSVKIFNSQKGPHGTLWDEKNLVCPTIPIRHRDVVIGTIYLGEKQSGDVYTMEDRALLLTFANQVAIAIENARLFSELEVYARELEERVESRTKEIKVLQERERQLFIDIAHNLQTPLTILRGRLGIIGGTILPKTDLFALEKTIDDISLFIYDILHFSQLEAEQHVLKREPVSLSTMLEEQVEYYEVVTQAEGILLKSEITPSITVTGNREKLKELLDNLMGNAVKYSKKDNSVKEITLSLREETATVTLTISDTGIGIDAGDLPRIFERFYRIKNNSTDKVSGTGLGLAICKKIAELHEGTIEVESKRGAGSKFTVTFPKVNYE